MAGEGGCLASSLKRGYIASQDSGLADRPAPEKSRGGNSNESKMNQIVQEQRSPAGADSESTTPVAEPRSAFASLALGSLGVVFGDIGTSPLYALRESLTRALVMIASGVRQLAGNHNL